MVSCNSAAEDPQKISSALLPPNLQSKYSRYKIKPLLWRALFLDAYKELNAYLTDLLLEIRNCLDTHEIERVKEILRVKLEEYENKRKDILSHQYCRYSGIKLG